MEDESYLPATGLGSVAEWLFDYRDVACTAHATSLAPSDFLKPGVIDTDSVMVSRVSGLGLCLAYHTINKQ